MATKKKTSEEWSAKRIRELRESLGETQEVFARRVGVSFVTMNRWENGRCKPSRFAERSLDAVAGKVGG